MPHSPATTIPVFKLYGEAQRWATPDLLHCETISKRSRLHHWQIQPHQHADLYQLLYVHRGQARIDIEGQQQLISRPTVQVVPPLCVHGFNFSADIDGYVLTLAAPLVHQLQAQMGPAMAVFARPASYPVGSERAYIHRLFGAVLREYQNEEPARDVLLHSLVGAALVWVGRQVLRHRAAGQVTGRAQAWMGRFMTRVEEDFRRHLTIEELAHGVGISVAHLNSICRELAGLSALQIVHQRLLLEAKRGLIYTNLSVSQLADSLGFADAAYFARFFRRLTGVSPKAFRQAGGSAEVN